MSCLTSDSIQPVPLPQTWRLVKLHKAATLAEHREAAEAALGMPNLCLGMPYVSFYFCPFNVNFEKKHISCFSCRKTESFFNAGRRFSLPFAPRKEFHFYPVERRRRDGPCVKVGAAITDTSSLDVLLLALPPDQLQVGIFFGPIFVWQFGDLPSRS